MEPINILNTAIKTFNDFLLNLHFSVEEAARLTNFALFFISILISILLFYITRWVLRKYITQYIKHSKTHWDNYLLEHRIFHKAAYLIPGFFVGYLIPTIFQDFEATKNFLIILVNIYKIIITVVVINSILDTLVHVYIFESSSKKLPIKGFAQIIKLLIWIISVVFIISILLNKNPTALFAGLGAVSAILLLIFKDPILGFVGGIQLAAFDMVKEGDWISLPKYDADGTVIDISITTVKVRNWDNTISTIPTYSLITDSVKNWRGMEESNGRRIKRSIRLDMHSVKFCTPEMLDRFSKFEYLEDYIVKTEELIKQKNQNRGTDTNYLVNGVRQTNIGVFRAYLNNYLTNHPLINHEMTTMVRQLEPTEKGIPMEIYVFSKIKSWIEYEGIQSDIFDHIMAVIPEFELQVFQEPSGADFQKALK